MKSLFLPSLATALSLQAGAAVALDFEMQSTSAGDHVLVLSGEFKSSDDLRKLEAFARKGQAVAVSFDSPGGNVYKAMEVGRLIRQLGLTTIQSRQDDCTSACALAFLGGVERFAEPGSIGVHKSSFDTDTSVSVNDAVSAVQQGTADILSYMSEMGVDPALLVLSLSYENTDVRYLSGSEMAKLRVTTGELPADEPAATNEAPGAEAPATKAPGHDAGKRKPKGATEMEAGLERMGLTAFAAMREELPAEYNALVHELADPPAGKLTPEEIRRTYGTFVARLRGQHAAELRSAPDDAIVAVIRVNLDFLDVVSRRESAAVCGEFLMWGAPALDLKDETYRRWIDKLDAALIRAFGAAHRHPHPVAAATRADWESMASVYEGTPDQFDIALHANYDNPGLCKAGALLVRSVVKAATPGARRLRVQMAYNVASSNRDDRQ